MANDPNVLLEYQNKIAAEGKTAQSCVEFRDHVASEWRPSINMRLHVAAKFVSGHGYQNIKSYAARMARISGRTSEEVYAEKLGKWQELRAAFEDFFADGSDFIYAAVNAGGVGPSRYAQFCLVFDRAAFLATAQVGFLRGDSLTDYPTDQGLPDFEAVTKELCSAGAVPESAALKLADVIAQADRANWATELCSNEGYMEAIYTGHLTPDHLEEVRLRSEDYAKLWALAFDDFSRQLDDGEAAIADDFSSLMEVLQTKAKPLQEVA